MLPGYGVKIDSQANRHFISGGYPNRNQIEHEQLLEQQRTVIGEEWNTRGLADNAANNFKRFGPSKTRESADLRGNWIQGYTANVSCGDPLPLDVVAHKWFRVPHVEDPSLYHEVRYLQAEQAKLRAKVAANAAECQEVSRKHAELVEKNAELAEKHDELVERHDELIARHNELEARYNDLRHRYRKKRETHERSEAEWSARLASADRERRIAEQQRDDLKQQLDALRSQSSYGPTSWNDRSNRVTIGRSISRRPGVERLRTRSSNTSASSSRNASPGDSGIDVSSSTPKHRRSR